MTDNLVKPIETLPPPTGTPIFPPPTSGATLPVTQKKKLGRGVVVAIVFGSISASILAVILVSCASFAFWQAERHTLPLSSVVTEGAYRTQNSTLIVGSVTNTTDTEFYEVTVRYIMTIRGTNRTEWNVTTIRYLKPGETRSFEAIYYRGDAEGYYLDDVSAEKM
jgi:hypothetical protein